MIVSYKYLELLNSTQINQIILILYCYGPHPSALSVLRASHFSVVNNSVRAGKYDSFVSISSSNLIVVPNYCQSPKYFRCDNAPCKEDFHSALEPL